MVSKMSSEDRAKQFMPFAALKGHIETLKKKEKIIVDKKELAEEYKEELDWKLRQIRKNDIVTVTYFERGEYIQMTGMVDRIDKTAGSLKIVNKKIAFTDLSQVLFETIVKR